jgi:hypothetical protein
LNALLSGLFLVGLTGPGDGCVGITPSNALILDLIERPESNAFKALENQGIVYGMVGFFEIETIYTLE